MFEILAGHRQSDHISFARWDSPDQLEQLIPKLIAEHLRFDPDLEEWQCFARSLGAQLDDGGSAWFNVAYGTRPSSGKMAEAWQVLSPVREKPWGVGPINRLIHNRYKAKHLEIARNTGKFRQIPAPMGEDQIVYGDKVINNSNKTIWPNRMYPKPEGKG